MPGNFYFAHFNGSWSCHFARTWCSDKLASGSFKNTTQRTVVPIKHPRTNIMIFCFPYLFLYCFSSQNLLNLKILNYKIPYFFYLLRKQIKDHANYKLLLFQLWFGLTMSTKEKGRVCLPFLSWKAFLEQLGLTKVFT